MDAATHQLNEVAEVSLHCLWRQPSHQVQSAVQLVIRVRLGTAGEAARRRKEKVEGFDGTHIKKMANVTSWAHHVKKRPFFRRTHGCYI